MSYNYNKDKQAESGSDADRSRQRSTAIEGEAYCISTIIFGGGEGAHREILIYNEHSHQGTLHHMKVDKDNGNSNLVYRREEGRLVHDHQLNGRIIHNRVNERDAMRASQILDEYGEDEPTNLCQVWALGGLQLLEKNGLVPEGTHEFWQENRRAKAIDIKKRVKDSGRGEWVSGPAEDEWFRSQEESKTRHVDASYVALEESSERHATRVGKLDMTKYSDLF